MTDKWIDSFLAMTDEWIAWCFEMTDEWIVSLQVVTG
jgi:hypothetical protein